MKRYQWLKLGGLGFLVALVLIGYAAIPLPGNEIFPFYSWTMFSLTPTMGDQFVVAIVHIHGDDLATPLDFQQAGGLVTNSQSIVAYRDIQNMGRALLAHDTEALDSIRHLFERNYLPPGTRYQLWRTHYDPLVHWRSRETDRELLQEWTRNE